MAIQTKEEYCRKRAEENTYDEPRDCIDPWTYEPCHVIWHHKATPEMFSEEYDTLFDLEYLRQNIKKNVKRINYLNRKISKLVTNWNIPRNPVIPEAKEENLNLLRSIRKLTEKRIKELERIKEISEK